MGNHEIKCQFCGDDLRSSAYWHCWSVERHEERCPQNPKNKDCDHRAHEYAELISPCPKCGAAVLQGQK
jgi:hypothetical protein